MKDLCLQTWKEDLSSHNYALEQDPRQKVESYVESQGKID